MEIDFLNISKINSSLILINMYFFIDTIKYKIKLNSVSLIMDYIIWILHLVKRKKI